MTEDDTFNTLKYHRYTLTVSILPSSDEEIDIILDGMRTTLDEPEITDEGVEIHRGLTLEELTSEIFCLGACYQSIESETDIVHPFEYHIEKEW